MTITMKKLKRALYLTHRWFGVALCVVFALWFASGIVMMYVEYPELTEEEGTYFLPALNFKRIQLPISALENLVSARENKIAALTLTTLSNRPAYQVQVENGKTITVFADTGELFAKLSPEQALVSAAPFGSNESSPTYMGKIDMDQWTVSGSLDQHRPLHKVVLNNPSKTVLYLSDTTGEVVRDTHGWERAWNWLGSTIHWIYPMQLRRHPGLWANIVIYLSLLGVLSAVTGTIIGFLRVRFKRKYKNGGISPYRGMQRWHHFLGLVCAVFVFTFVLSGLFSMNPWGIFDNATSPSEQTKRYHGESYSVAGLQGALDKIKSNHVIDEIKELSWINIGGEGVLVLNTSQGRQAIGYPPGVFKGKLSKAISTIIPGNLSHIEKLDHYDNYYYSTHNRYRPLPVYRAVFTDTEKTWFYINANSGELLGRSTRVDRIARWLYNGLHSLDFRFLLAYRPLWDIVVIVLSLAGLAFCWTSLVIAWRRLNIKIVGRQSLR